MDSIQSHLEQAFLEFYHLTWHFFVSWTFFFAVAFFLFLKWFRRQPSEIENVLNSDPPEDHFRFKNCPPFYPNGWLPALPSRDLGKHGIKPLFVFGQDLVAWRGAQSGRVHVFDAYCPHLGANIGVGGSVEGEEVRCPFHGWHFDSKGKACFVPNLDKKEIPKASVKVWHVHELNGWILVWHEKGVQGGGEGAEPKWRMQEVAELREEYPLRARWETLAACHVQDVQENAHDERHFRHVHRLPSLLLWLSSKFNSGEKQKIVSADWTSEWSFEEHVARGRQTYRYRVRETEVLSMKAEVWREGPALTVQKWDIRVFQWFSVRVYHVVGVVQVGEVCQQLTSHIHAKSRLVALLFKLVLIKEVLRDKSYWDKKKFVVKPVCIKADKSMVWFREWFKQFYQDDCEYCVEFEENRCWRMNEFGERVEETWDLQEMWKSRDEWERSSMVQ